MEFGEKYVWNPEAPLDESFIDVSKMTVETSIPDPVRIRSNRSALVGMRIWYLKYIEIFNSFPEANRNMIVENDDWAYHFILCAFLKSPRFLQTHVDVEMACRDNLETRRLKPAFVGVCHMISDHHDPEVKERCFNSLKDSPSAAVIVLTEMIYHNLLNPFVPLIAHRVRLAAIEAIKEGLQ